MNIYNVSGNALTYAFDLDGDSLSQAYDVSQNVWRGFEKAATDILSWLSLALEDVSAGKRVKERYRMDTNAWATVYRPDCAVESALAFYKAWQKLGDGTYLTIARGLCSFALSLQNSDGSFPFSTARTTKYSNDNSEISIFLIRCAEIDTDNASTYRTAAIGACDYLLTTQASNGSFPVSTQNSTKTALFTAHVVSALATAYTFADSAKKATYETAIENGLSFINSQILTGGRIKCCYEVNTSTEYWRAPMSDQCVCIRAYALAEIALPDNANCSSWETDRASLSAYLTTLVSTEGAVRNGPGTGINGADIYYYTDHIYVTAFGIEAYHWSYAATQTAAYKTKEDAIIAFCQSNLYSSNDVNTNGTTRGAYNLQEKNWNTDEYTLDASSQVGSKQIYTGWTNAPIVCFLIDSI